MFRIIQYSFSTQTITETEALLQKLTKKASITLSRDNYQVNLGLMIQRNPIFLKYTEQEMERTKKRYQLERKYNLIPKLHKDMYEFQRIQSQGEINDDDVPSHVRMIGDERTLFREHSKQFKFVNPYCSDPHSIQYAGLYTTYLLVKENNQWQFPVLQIEDKTTFSETKDKLFKRMTNNKWEVFYFDRQPRCLVIDEHQEKTSKINGVKTYYFQAQHVHGKMFITDNYQDYAWATRLEMNKYLNQNLYEKIIHSLDL